MLWKVVIFCLVFPKCLYAHLKCNITCFRIYITHGYFPTILDSIYTLHVSPNHIFLAKLGVGQFTNTRAELVALWSLLYFAASLGLPSLMVWGDSQVVINWENTKVGLNVLDLVHWCEHIVALKSSFLSLNFSHIYRELNLSVDALSK